MLIDQDPTGERIQSNENHNVQKLQNNDLQYKCLVQEITFSAICTIWGLTYYMLFKF